MEESQARKLIVEVGKLLYERSYVVAFAITFVTGSLAALILLPSVQNILTLPPQTPVVATGATFRSSPFFERSREDCIGRDIYAERKEGIRKSIRKLEMRLSDLVKKDAKLEKELNLLSGPTNDEDLDKYVTRLKGLSKADTHRLTNPSEAMIRLERMLMVLRLEQEQNYEDLLYRQVCIDK
jgi:hypothetical protein